MDNGSNKGHGKDGISQIVINQTLMPSDA